MYQSEKLGASTHWPKAAFPSGRAAVRWKLPTTQISVYASGTGTIFRGRQQPIHSPGPHNKLNLLELRMNQRCECCR